MAWIVIAILAVLVVAVEGYLASGPGTNSGGPIGVDLRIIEDDPVLQIDHFYPDTIYVPLNATIQLAVQDGDDETRTFTLSQFSQNTTIYSGTTMRLAFQANQLGNFSFISPITPPSLVSNGRQGPCLMGFLIVTNNATLLSQTVHAGSGVPPSLAAAEAASAGAVGSCSKAPLTAP